MSTTKANPRQASVGDIGVKMENVGRPSLEDHRSKSSATNGENSVDNSEANVSSRSYGEHQRHNEALDVGIGDMAAFRAPALAKRWMSTSRRQLLRQSIREDSMRRLNVQGSPVLNENVPLINKRRGSGQIPELEHESSVEIDEKETLVQALRDIIFGKIVSFFLLAGPFAWAAHHFQWDSAWVFWLNFLVMIPLAAILGDFTEEVALHTNQTVGGLVNATFGNAVEIVVAVQALLSDEIRVVQASMIGSIFSNLLLVLGCCFFFGGLKYKEQHFNSTAATANMALLALSSIALVLPTPFAEYYNIQDNHVLTISRIAAVFLMSMYIQLLIFQLKTHADIFDDEGQPNAHDDDQSHDEEDEEEASIPMSVALLGLAATTLLVTIFSDYLVGSIDEYCESSGLSRTFVGLIILPIVGNAVEHMTAVTVAMKNKMDLAMGVAVGSCTQISLFVVPLTVLVGWAANKPMTLNFPHFEISLYVLSVVTVSICLSNPKGNWLEGSLLITTYLMIAVGFWFENVVNF